MEVKAPLAYVRQDGGGTVQLHQGDTVPDGVDAEHIAQLTTCGVLGDSEPPAKSDKVEDILAEVGADKEKAAAALAAEREARGDKARKTLVEPLEALLAIHDQRQGD